MKRRGLGAVCVILLVGVGVLAVGAGFAKDENAAEAKCSEATLDGRYLVAQNGVVVKVKKPQFPGPRGPFAVAGYEVFDGNGNVEGTFSFNFNGLYTRKVGQLPEIALS
jgi:hypothetical protein